MRPHHAACQEYAILDLTFTQVARFRPFEIVAPGFEQVVCSAAGDPELTLSAETPPAPFAAVQVDITGEGPARVGLATQSGDWVGAVHHDGHLALEVRRAGRTRTVKSAPVERPGRLALVLCENRVTALAHQEAGWQPVLSARRRVTSRLNRPGEALDLRRPETLRRFRYAWSAPEGSAVTAGPFGMTGLRDPHLVSHADGTPYQRDGRMYLTWTCAGLGGFQQAHWGVFALDPRHPTRLEQTAQLYTERDGLLLGDHAGHLVRDGDRWIVLTSAWGDFRPGSVHVRHTTTTADLVSGVHLLRTQPLRLPTPHATWDPGLARIDGHWHVSFVESSSQRPFRFHPALAAGPLHAPDWCEGLEPRGAAAHLTQCEGPILTRSIDHRDDSHHDPGDDRGDAWWLLASDGKAREYLVFDLDLKRLGRLHAPYPTNIPHPQTIPLRDGGHLLVTFDGTGYAEQTMGYGGHGDVLVMRAP